MEDSRVCVIHFCLEKGGKKKRMKSEGGGGGGRVKLMPPLFSCGFGVKLPGLRVVFSSCSHLC